MSFFGKVQDIPGLPPGALSLSNTLAKFQNSAQLSQAAKEASYKTSTAAAKPPGAPQPTSIVLTLVGSSVPMQLLQAVVPRSPGSPGRAPQVGMTQSTPGQLGQLTFDTTIAADGLAQNISYSFSARQTTHQTAGGYYVDEFGEAPGSLAIDLLVLSTGGLPDQLRKFKSLLDNAKLSNPLSPSFPATLTYVNSYDGCSFIITQTRIDFREEAERPNTLMVSISGDILQDYAQPPARTSSSGVATVANNVQPAAVASQSSILNFVKASILPKLEGAAISAIL